MSKNLLAKKIALWLSVIWLVLGLLLLYSAVGAIRNWSASLLPIRTIIVTGEGETVLVPNIAGVSFSVVSEGKDVVALQNDNNTKINNAINFVKNLGVAADDVKTTGYNLSPKYEYDEKKRRSYIDGYNLTQTVVLKIRDLNKVAEILGGLPGLGINQINGPNFSVDDLNKNLKEARAAAFKDAYEKANELAALNGVRLGRVVTFNEQQGGYPGPVFLEKAVFGMGGDGPMPPMIEKGSEEVNVRVTVTYEIK